MRTSIAGAITIAIGRAAVIVLGGIALCTCVLGAIGFALVAFYSFLAPTLGAAGAALATSGVAIGIPLAVIVTTLVIMRAWTMDGYTAAPSIPTVATAPSGGRQLEPMRLENTLGWIADHPRTATLGALSLGIALGAYPDLRKTILSSVESTLSQDRVPAA